MPNNMPIKTSNSICLFIIFMIIILWQMLLPGYILTLDMVFTPEVSASFGDGSFYNSLPLKYLFRLLNLFLDGWIIQKLMLIAVFFCIGYLAFKFLPIPQKYGANFWAAIFYTINPFVYERFLAGHWQLLFAYAFLSPFIFYLLKFAKMPNWQTMVKLLIWLFLIGLFSLHLWLMAILSGFILLVVLITKNLIVLQKNNLNKLLKYGLILALAIFILSSYWLIPFLLKSKNSLLNSFTPENIQLFKTTTDSRLGTTLNTLALYGFWQENQPWAKYWLWPKDNLIFWSVIAVLLAMLILAGLIHGFRNKETRKTAWFFLCLGIFAFIFSCGLGETIFKAINSFLFDHIYFWRGFRDSQKWSGLLALSYAYFGSIGLIFAADLVKSRKINKIVILIIFLLPLFYTYTELGGFSRQLQPVWYPDSWQQVRQIINQDTSDFKILFLPWHGYFSLEFNNKLITANPAKMFFGKRIIQSQSMDMQLGFQESIISENKQIEKLIINKKQLTDQEISAIWQSENIKYVIFARDLNDADIFSYNFLHSKQIIQIFTSPEIFLGKIE